MIKLHLFYINSKKKVGWCPLDQLNLAKPGLVLKLPEVKEKPIYTMDVWYAWPRHGLHFKQTVILNIERRNTIFIWSFPSLDAWQRNCLLMRQKSNLMVQYPT